MYATPPSPKINKKKKRASKNSPSLPSSSDVTTSALKEEKKNEKMPISTAPTKTGSENLEKEERKESTDKPALAPDTEIEIELGNNDDTEFIKPKKTQKIPPIVIKDDAISWKALTKLIDAGNTGTYTAKLTGYGTYTIKVEEPATHRAITALLDKQNISYHTYVLPEDRNIKVVIKGIPADIPEEEIAEELVQSGYTILSVNQLTSRRYGDKIKLPMFLITLPKSERSRDIYNEMYLLRLRIQVDTYRGRKGPTQCHKCQGYFHAQRHCHHKPRCVKCAGNHLSIECVKDKTTPPTCALCGGNHTANWRGCPNSPTNHINKFTQPGISYAQKTREKYNGRTITNSAYSENHPNNFTGANKSLFKEAGDTLNELKEMMSFIKDSGIIEIFRSLRSSQQFTTSNNV